MSKFIGTEDDFQWSPSTFKDLSNKYPSEKSMTNDFISILLEENNIAFSIGDKVSLTLELDFVERFEVLTTVKTIIKQNGSSALYFDTPPTVRVGCSDYKITRRVLDMGSLEVIISDNKNKEPYFCISEVDDLKNAYSGTLEITRC